MSHHSHPGECCRYRTTLEIDAALNELGMLSTVPECRKQYLRDHNRTKSESSTANPPHRSRSQEPFKILHIEPAYITGFSVERTVTPNSKIYGSSSLFRALKTSEKNLDLGKYRTNVGDVESEAKNRRTTKSRLSRSQRFKKPYEVPWRLYHSFSGVSNVNIEQTMAENCQSKSNTSSPAKPSNECRTLTRSRSLENLDISQLRISDLNLSKFFDNDSSNRESAEIIPRQSEIENVSQNLQNLQVVD